MARPWAVRKSSEVMPQSRTACSSPFRMILERIWFSGDAIQAPFFGKQAGTNEQNALLRPLSTAVCIFVLPHQVLAWVYAPPTTCGGDQMEGASLLPETCSPRPPS